MRHFLEFEKPIAELAGKIEELRRDLPNVRHRHDSRAAVLHQARIGPQQAAGVDPQRQILAHALGGVAIDKGLGLGVRPQTVHQAAFSCSG